MKPSSFQTAIRLQFDCLVKRVIDTTVKDYQRELSRRATHEIAFSELPEQELKSCRYYRRLRQRLFLFRGIGNKGKG